MLYKNFKTDQTFNQLELEEAANAENIGIDEYITKYDLQRERNLHKKLKISI